MQQRINDIVFAKPGIVERWGDGLCVETPLYPSKQKSIPVYINIPLFHELFGITEQLSFDEISILLQNAFSTTIEKDLADGDAIGTAYVDQQADPLDLSLSGNLGSGRAYYIGQYFNIKGEKTPLAKSKLRKFSDGYLEMERAIWETVISNALQKSITTGIHGVLAIFDMNEMCEVPWRDKPVKRGKIIRVDTSGELDRVTHYFKMNKPMTADDLKHTARCYGRLEADKFIERITHGTWSAGNISTSGHFIDFDTVNAVKGRCPLYSSTRWYHENRFGYEYLGQIHILKSLTDHKEINMDDVAANTLIPIVKETRQTHIERGFLKLMGFDDPNDTLHQTYKSDIKNMTAMFIELSRKCAAKQEYFVAKSFEAPAVHLYDLSFFMRLYPMFKRTDIFNTEDIFNRIHHSDILKPDLNPVPETLTDIEQEHMDKVYDVIAECFVTSDMALKFLNIAVMGFIKEYDALFQKIITEQNLQNDLGHIETRAYVLNEDRFYLFPHYTPSYRIAQDVYDAPQKKTHDHITALIQANTRHVHANDTPYICDIRIYAEGILYHRCNTKGQYQICIDLFDSAMLPNNMEHLVADIDGTKYDLSLQKQGDKNLLASAWQDRYNFLSDITRDSALHIPRILLYTQIEHKKEDKRYFEMTDLLTEN